MRRWRRPRLPVRERHTLGAEQMSFIDRVAACQQFDPGAYVPFVVDGQTLGYLKPDFQARLADFTEVFTVSGSGLTFRSDLVGYAERTAAVQQ